MRLQVRVLLDERHEILDGLDEIISDLLSFSAQHLDKFRLGLRVRRDVVPEARRALRRLDGVDRHAALQRGEADDPHGWMYDLDEA